jgi:acyl-CoA synthetase (AMP-forming)/AMP-acid ligase II
VKNSRCVLAALFLAGCAVHPIPTEQLERSETAIAAAHEAGAAELAAADLRSAQEKVKLGKRWIEARDYRPARWLIEQAEVDAELATMKAISAKAAREAELRQFDRRLALDAR